MAISQQEYKNNLELAATLCGFKTDLIRFAGYNDEDLSPEAKSIINKLINDEDPTRFVSALTTRGDG